MQTGILQVDKPSKHSFNTVDSNRYQESIYIPPGPITRNTYVLSKLQTVSRAGRMHTPRKRRDFEYAATSVTTIFWYDPIFRSVVLRSGGWKISRFYWARCSSSTLYNVHMCTRISSVTLLQVSTREALVHLNPLALENPDWSASKFPFDSESLHRLGFVIHSQSGLTSVSIVYLLVR